MRWIIEFALKFFWLYGGLILLFFIWGLSDPSMGVDDLVIWVGGAACLYVSFNWTEDPR
jgi:hypothetical protein